LLSSKSPGPAEASPGRSNSALGRLLRRGLRQRNQVADDAHHKHHQRRGNILAKVETQLGRGERDQASNQTSHNLAVRQPLLHPASILRLDSLNLTGARFREPRAENPIPGVLTLQPVDGFVDRGHYLPCISRVKQPPVGIREWMLMVVVPLGISTQGRSDRPALT